jgi:hypothetical protein
MIKGFATGIASFILVGALFVAFIFPFVFSTVSGLFGSGDTVGIIAGLVACLIVGYVGFQLALLLSIGLGVLVAVLFDEG